MGDSKRSLEGEGGGVEPEGGRNLRYNRHDSRRHRCPGKGTGSLRGLTAGHLSSRTHLCPASGHLPSSSFQSFGRWGNWVTEGWASQESALQTSGPSQQSFPCLSGGNDWLWGCEWKQLFPNNSSLCSETAPPGGLLSRINSYRPFDKPVNGAISFTVLRCRPFPQYVRLFRTVNQHLDFLLPHFCVRSPSNSPHRGSTCGFCFLSLSGLQKTVHIPCCHFTQPPPQWAKLPPLFSQHPWRCSQSLP